MSTTKWVKIEGRWCELIHKDIEILEKRIYPAEIMPDMGSYHVIACKCSADLDCNQAGVQCQYAYTSPGHDPMGKG